MNLQSSLNLWRPFHGQTNRECAEALYQSVINSPPGDVVEVGSASGGTTIVLIGAAQEVNKQVYSIDPYPEHLEGVANDYTPGLMQYLKNEFKKNILWNSQYKNITQFNDDIKDCINKLPNKLSVVLIDGCHEFENVKTEFDLLFPRLVNGGYLFIDDAYWLVGQVSKTVGTGVAAIVDYIKDIPVTDKYLIGPMLVIKK